MLGQKTIQKSYPGEGIGQILIEGSGVFNIKVSARDTPTIMVKSQVNGEGFENILLQLKDKNGTLVLGHNYTPFFEPPNDKLAAHKVLAIEMELVIPLDLNVSILSNLASVEGSGSFKELRIGLDKGMIALIDFSGNAHLSTKEGDIKVEALALSIGAKATSKNGLVVNQLGTAGKFKMIVESVNGDITLLKSQ